MRTGAFFSNWWRYGFAVIAVAVAVAVRSALHGIFGSQAAFITFFPAVALVALVAGGRAGVLATVLSVVAADWWFIEPYGFLSIGGLGDALALGLFAVAGTLTSVMAAMLGRARERQAALAEREHFAAIVDSSDDAIISKDLNGVIQSWNHGAREIFGYTAEELVGKPIALLIPAERLAEEQSIFKRLCAGERVSHLETVRVAKNGRRVEVSATISPVKDVAGRVIGASTIARDITERKQAAEAMRQQREWLRVTLTSIGDAVLTTDTAGNITFLNPAAEGLTGWPLAEAMGQPSQNVFKTINERTRAPGDDIVGRVLREKSIIALANHTALVSRDGHEIPIEDSAAPIKDGGGAVVGMVLVFHDVSEKRHTQSALREREEQLRLFVQHAPAAIAMFDTRMRYVVASRRWLSDYNLPGQTIEGRSHYEVFPEIDERWKEIHRRCLGGATERAAEDHFDRADGAVQWLHWEAHPWRVASGAIGGIVIFSEDITARKKQQDELQRLNRTLRALNNSNQAILRAADEAKFLAQICRIVVEDCGHTMVWIGFAEDDGEKSVRPVASAGFETGYLDSLRISWADTDHGRGPTGRAIRTGKVVACTNMLADPAFLPWRQEALKHGFAASISLPLLSEARAFGALTIYFTKPDPLSEQETKLLGELAENLAFGILTLRSHAAQKAAEEAERAARAEAEHANQVKDEFLAVLSHELRTPLTSMLGWVKMLQDGRLNDTTREKGLAVIERNVKAQTHIIEDLLDVSRIIAGKLTVTKSPVELVAVARETVEMLKRLALDKGVALRFAPSVPLLVDGDGARLQQVVWNLLSNALKFTPAGGWVELSVARADDWALLRVKDNGRGISQKFLPHMFDRFSQEDSSTGRRYTGLGLGLAIVRHIAEQHGGSVSAHSDGEGKGAAFTVRLPLLAVEASGEAVPVVAARAVTPLTGRRILVVEDNQDVRELMTETLRIAGAEVDAAPTADQALRVFREFKPALLVCDIGLPGDDGCVLIRKLRKLEDGQGNKPVPAIALTGYAQPEDVQRCRAAGFQTHLTKPIEPESLIAAAQNMLSD